MFRGRMGGGADRGGPRGRTIRTDRVFYDDEKPKIALFVDGPNMLRKEFMIDLRELKKSVLKYGRVVTAKVFVNQFAPEKLIEAIINEGFESVMILAEIEAEKNDIDVAMAIHATESAIAKDVQYIALATRDADYMPVIHMAKSYGKRVIVIGAEPGMSSGLQNAADYVEML
jgi:uncharacterized protein (TIGR00288 family)